MAENPETGRVNSPPSVSLKTHFYEIYLFSIKTLDIGHYNRTSLLYFARRKDSRKTELNWEKAIFIVLE